jgi:hypothetical protein
MKFDPKTPILDLDDKPVMSDGEKPQPVTIGSIARQILISTLPDEKATPRQKEDRFLLAVKIKDKPIELSVDEVKTLKDLIGLAYGPLIVGRANAILDPK